MTTWKETTWDMEIGGVCVAQIDCRVEWFIGDLGDLEIGRIELDGLGKDAGRVMLDGGDPLYGLAAGQIEARMDRRILDDIRTELEDDARMDAPAGSRRAA